jgi:hypothetical protein
MAKLVIDLVSLGNKDRVFGFRSKSGCEIY